MDAYQIALIYLRWDRRRRRVSLPSPFAPFESKRAAQQPNFKRTNGGKAIVVATASTLSLRQL
jgi:hypothetical protein